MNQLVSAMGPSFRERIFKALRKTECSSTRTLLMDILKVLDSRPSFEWVKEQYGLSPAEYKALDLLLSGKSPKQIAETNGTSTNTVRVQINNVYRKTGVSSREALAALVIRGPQE